MIESVPLLPNLAGTFSGGESAMSAVQSRRPEIYLRTARPTSVEDIQNASFLKAGGMALPRDPTRAVEEHGMGNSSDPEMSKVGRVSVACDGIINGCLL